MLLPPILSTDQQHCSVLHTEAQHFPFSVTELLKIVHKTQITVSDDDLLFFYSSGAHFSWIDVQVVHFLLIYNLKMNI